MKADINILEGSKLIAEFMGATFRTGLTYSASNCACYWSNEFKPSYNGIGIENLKFHECWVWLMPVVEKIKTIKYVDEFNIQYDSVAKGTYMQITPAYKYTFDQFYVEPTENTLEGLYKIVCEFIEWYTDFKS